MSRAGRGRARGAWEAGTPLLALALSLVPSGASAKTLAGTPATYRGLLPTLAAGDRLDLAAGTYAMGLPITGLAGTESAPIVISGPASGAPAVFEGDACCNTVEITNSSYVVVRNLTIDGKGKDGVFGVSAKDGATNLSHHVTIEGCTLVGQGASQQTVGISTKAPVWNWVIRGNRISGAGTGMYLGNSDGSQPFIAGIIEGNLVEDSIGYDMQIKHQNPWPAVAGLPAGDTRTVIRHNVFIKNDAPSPDGDRPNVLVDGFPDSGPGSGNMVELHGNLFLHNPRESLLQASGRVSIHDNLFVDASDKAILLTDHNTPLKLAHVYNNTIYAAARGVVFGATARTADAVVGNLIFAGSGVSGPVTIQRDNLLDTVANAAMTVVAPGKTLGAMDFYPLAGKATGAPLDLSPFAADPAWRQDFNGTDKGALAYRGAYAGAGANPGWKPMREPKKLPGGGASRDGGAPGDGGESGDGGSSGEGGGQGDGGAQGDGAGEAGGDGPAAPGGQGGCGCRAGGERSRDKAGRAGLPLVLGAAVVAATFAGRRRRLAWRCGRGR